MHEYYDNMNFVDLAIFESKRGDRQISPDVLCILVIRIVRFL